MVRLKKLLDLEDFYQSVEAIPKDIRFVGKMCDLVKEKAGDYLPVRTEDTCLKNNPTTAPQFTITRYDENTFEYFMWMTSLICMSWLLTNVSKKTRNGHCHNKVQDEKQKQTGYTGCSIGSAFHAQLYEDIVDSVDYLLTFARTNRPETVPDSKEG